ncbi:MAG: universal stress protein [Bacteroidota bacterium]|nr:universal stress protein [Candidatus Kapabacteria bacterium]MDW8219913.1 universal stress protein [Bacteroidota bacterium]
MKNVHMLVATDFSSTWIDRLPDLAKFLAMLNCTVSMVHVLTSPFKLWLEADSLELQAQERLEHWLRLMREQGITTDQALIRTGNAAEEIILAAQELAADSIMIAADAKRSFLGSTAEAVVRNAHCSVWVVHTPHATTLQHIVCACDMSRASAKALQHAYYLAEQSQARLDALYCLELPDTNTLGMSKSQAEETYRSHKTRISQEFEQFIAATLGMSTLASHINVHVMWGKPSNTILTFAGDAHVDVIVLGAKGKSNLQILTLGSTAHNILRSSRCSLYIVR